MCGDIPDLTLVLDRLSHLQRKGDGSVENFLGRRRDSVDSRADEKLNGYLTAAIVRQWLLLGVDGSRLSFAIPECLPVALIRPMGGGKVIDAAFWLLGNEAPTPLDLETLKTWTTYGAMWPLLLLTGLKQGGGGTLQGATDPYEESTESTYLFALAEGAKELTMRLRDFNDINTAAVVVIAAAVQLNIVIGGNWPETSLAEDLANTGNARTKQLLFLALLRYCHQNMRESRLHIILSALGSEPDISEAIEALQTVLDANFKPKDAALRMLQLLRNEGAVVKISEDLAVLLSDCETTLEGTDKVPGKEKDILDAVPFLSLRDNVQISTPQTQKIPHLLKKLEVEQAAPVPGGSLLVSGFEKASTWISSTLS